MPRWSPGADGRLYNAAMQLIVERGYDKVTVAEIAEHAGLKKRTFFRYYADKREVLFAGSAEFEHSIVEAVRAAPATAAALDAVIGALAEAGTGLASWGEPVRQRQRVIASSPELRERELFKMQALAASVAQALSCRGVEGLTATLVAQVGVTAFTSAFQQWTEATGPQDFSTSMQNVLGHLRAAVCPH